MKIALCLHGLFSSEHDPDSNGNDGFLHIHKHILSRFDTDIYVHSWEPDNKEKIENLYHPVISKYENKIDFGPMIRERKLDTLKNCPRSPQAVLSHLYSVSEVISLAIDSNTKYDIVIKARFDLGRINRKTSGPGRGNPYPVQCINLLDEIENDKIYMADWNHFHMGPADMWFYGSTEIMKKFKTLYKTLESQMFLGSEFHDFATKIENNTGDLSNSIAFYKWWMMKNQLWENKITLNTEWE